MKTDHQIHLQDTQTWKAASSCLCACMGDGGPLPWQPQMHLALWLRGWGFPGSPVHFPQPDLSLWQPTAASASLSQECECQEDPRHCSFQRDGCGGPPRTSRWQRAGKLWMKGSISDILICPGTGTRRWRPACPHPCGVKQLPGGHGQEFTAKPVSVVLPASHKPSLLVSKAWGKTYHCSELDPFIKEAPHRRFCQHFCFTSTCCLIKMFW